MNSSLESRTGQFNLQLRQYIAGNYLRSRHDEEAIQQELPLHRKFPSSLNR
jgi:hypothetical protein